MLSSGRFPFESSRKRGRRRGVSVWPRVSVLEGRVLPATFVVNSFLDTPDAKPGDGLAFDAAGRTTLRAAVMEASAKPDADTIILSIGTYTLTLAGAGEDRGATGDLDVINTTLTITGVDASQTRIDANRLDRLFDVQPGAGLSLYGVSLTGGSAADVGSGGGAIRVGSGATLILESDVLRDNAATAGPGGAVLITGGVLDTTSTLFDTNTAQGSGGAVAVQGGGSATILAAAFVGNAAPGGGGLAVLDGSAVVTYSTFSGNTATSGGAILVSAGGLTQKGVTLEGSTVSANSAATGAGLLALGPFSVFSSIVAGNTGGDDVNGPFTSRGHNLIGDGSAGTGFNSLGDIVGTVTAPIDARLSGLGLHDGPTPNYVPYPGSPALDAGDTTGLASTDQRGLARTQGAASDIGAVEARTFTLTNLSAGAHATAGSAFNPPLQVQLKEGGSGLAGVPVRFIPPDFGPGGFFADSSPSSTDASGIATASTYTANFTAGSYSIRADVGGALTVTLPVVNDAATGVTALVTIDKSQAQSTAGNPVPVTITVRDSSGQPITNFSGTVTVSSDDPLGDPPVVVGFTGTSVSTLTVPITLRQAGGHTIRAMLDAQSGGGSATSTIVVAAAAASTLVLQAPSQVDAGSAFAVTILAKDQFGNLATSYSGPVTLSSSDPQAVLPTVTFAPGTGMASVSGVILRSAGSQSLAGKDAKARLQADASLTVIPPGVTLDPVAGNEGGAITLTGRFPAGATVGASTVTINWGDGTGATTLQLAAGTNSFSAAHTYAASSAAGFPISALVTDSAGGVFSGSGTAQIANVSPTVTLADDRVVITQDQPFTSAGAFTDPGNDTWAATVNYGDGTGDQPLLLNADKSFSLQHVYSTEGTFTVFVTVRDNDGGVGIAQEQAAVFLAGTSGLVAQDVAPGETATVVSNGVTVVYTNNSPNVTATVVIGRVSTAALAALGTVPGTVDAYDVRVLNGDPRSVLVATFSFTDNATGTGIPIVATFDETLGRFVLVQGSRQFLGSFVIDQTANTVTVLIDQTSRPTLTSLGGTLFTLSVPNDAPQAPSSQVFLTPVAGQTLVAADPGLAVRQGSTTNLVSSSEVTLTLAASEGLRRGGFDGDEPRRLPLDVKTIQRVYETVTDISALLIETIRMFIDLPAPMVAPMNPAPENPAPQAADQIRVDDLVPAAAAHARLAEPPIVIDVPSDVFTAPRQSFSDAVWFARRAEPADDYTQDLPIRARVADEPSDDERFAALLTGLWVGGTALHASAPGVWIDGRPAQRPRWRPRKIDDVSKN